MFDKGTVERKVAAGASVLIGFLVIGAVFFHYMEHWSWIDSTYFSVVTLSTIGYGDLVPKQDITKIFIMFYIIFGVSTVLYVFTTIGSYYMEQHDKYMQKTMKDVQINRDKLKHATKKLNSVKDEFKKDMIGGIHKSKKSASKMKKKLREELEEKSQ